MIKNDIVYHVHIFSLLMPCIKKKFDTLVQAYDFVKSYYDENFPWNRVAERHGWDYVKERVENSFCITRIDLLKSSEGPFKEGIFH